MLPISDRFRAAVAYALDVHAGQSRKHSQVPYVSHLFGVTALAMEHGADEDQAIAALLHDAVEDHGGLSRLADIRARFGGRVAAIVEACSDSLAADPKSKAPWRERKELYLSHLREADADARLVSVCDKLHNARTIVSEHLAIGDEVFRRFVGDEPDPGRKKAAVLWYYRSLAEIFLARGPAGPARELARVVAELLRCLAPITPSSSPRCPSTRSSARACRRAAASSRGARSPSSCRSTSPATGASRRRGPRR